MTLAQKYTGKRSEIKWDRGLISRKRKTQRDEPSTSTKRHRPQTPEEEEQDPILTPLQKLAEELGSDTSDESFCESTLDVVPGSPQPPQRSILKTSTPIEEPNVEVVTVQDVADVDGDYVSADDSDGGKDHGNQHDSGEDEGHDHDYLEEEEEDDSEDDIENYNTWKQY